MVIKLSDVLAEMERKVNDKPIVFSVSFWTCDKAKGTGGDLIELVGVKLNRNKIIPPKDKSTGPSSSFAKRANHYTNATRNFLLPNGQIRKAHIRLIHMFNGQEVHW